MQIHELKPKIKQRQRKVGRGGKKGIIPEQEEKDKKEELELNSSP
jgi:hypothetical protein